MNELYDTDLEVNLLSSIMCNTKIIPDTRAFGVTLDTFYRHEHRIIYKAMLTMSDNDEPVDMVTLTDFLKRHDCLARIGGVRGITSICGTMPTAANWKYYANSLILLSQKRKAVETIEAFKEAVYSDPEKDDFIKSICATQGHLSDIVLNGSSAVENVADSIKRFDDWLVLRCTGDDGKMRTGLSNVDNRYGSPECGQLVIVAGRPSMGKSAYALQCIINQARKGKRIALFSVEMTENEILARMVANLGGFDLAKVFNPTLLTAEDNKRLDAATEEIASWSLTIECERYNTPSKILARARQIEAKQGLDIVYIDHIHRMNADGGWKANENGNAKYTSISNDLKHVAMTLNVPVVAVAQLNRSVESRTDKTPQLSDLRDSGSIEQDADVVQLLYRPSYYENSDEQGSDVIGDETQLIIAKNRNGKTGIAALRFIPQVQRFIDSDFVATHEKVEVPE